MTAPVVLPIPMLRVRLDAADDAALDAICKGHAPELNRSAMVRALIHREKLALDARTAESELLARKVMRMGQLATGVRARIKKAGDPDYWLTRWAGSDREAGPFETYKEACAVMSHGAYSVKCWREKDGSIREDSDSLTWKGLHGLAPMEPVEPAPIATESIVDIRKRAIPPQVVKYWQIAHRRDDSEPYHVELFVCDADAMAYSRTLPADVLDVEFLEPL